MKDALFARHPDLGLFLVRSMLGVVFVYHGAQKLFGLFGGYGLEGTAGWMESVGIPFPLVSAALYEHTREPPAATVIAGQLTAAVVPETSSETESSATAKEFGLTMVMSPATAQLLSSSVRTTATVYP